MHLNFLLPPAWMDDAACASKPDDHVWFPTYTTHTPPAARETCAACPVRLTCLQDALDNNLDGIWGGTNKSERDQLKGVA